MEGDSIGFIAFGKTKFRVWEWIPSAPIIRSASTVFPSRRWTIGLLLDVVMLLTE